MAVQFKKTDKGEVAILPRTEYEKLVARARKEVAAGAPLIPLGIAERIANGESPLKVLREWRDVTQAYLSFKTGIGQGYISDLESGRRKGTVAAWSAIAKVLNVPLDILVAD